MAAISVIIFTLAFFLAPVIPWILFPFSRGAGGVFAVLLIISAAPLFVLYSGEFIYYASVVTASALGRLVAEMCGAFEGARARRRQIH
jgi:hypothetical protein